jgi:uncharacterized membrane protein
MTGVEIAFLAQILLGISLIVDKIFFGDHGEIKVVPYVFWIAILSSFGFIFFFFNFTMPDIKTLGLIFLAGLSFILMLLSYYEVLSRGEASEAAPVVGGFAPLATYILGSFFVMSKLNTSEVIAFSLLILGGFILFFAERANLKELLPWTILAALFTASTNILEKMVFDHTANFATGYALMKSATFLIGLLMLVIPKFRKNILGSSKRTSVNNRILYFGNRALAGLGALLIFYAIKLERNPAIIESINGFRYVVVFFLAFILTKFLPSLIKEDMRPGKVIEKITATLLIVTGLAMLGIQRHYESLPLPGPSEVRWGVTFSELMTDDLKINADETLRAIIKDLKPGGLRLVAYWNRIEPHKGQYNFKSLDAQMLIAAKANIPVILAIGQRVPRWPECHIPEWASPEKDLIPYIIQVVKRYRGYKNILYWQVENEPFLHFGECKRVNKKLIESEIFIVQGFDPGRKILLTDGGEMGDWYRAAKRGSIFGTTLYRKVYNRFFGQITYPITPEIYPLKRDIIKFLTDKPDQNFIIIELGTEPWGDKQIVDMTLNEQLENFSVMDFKDNIDYALKCRFDTYYLWGAEWWYYLKKKQGINSYWNYAAEVFQAGKRVEEFK